jgi:hypothetical protein
MGGWDTAVVDVCWVTIQLLTWSNMIWELRCQLVPRGQWCWLVIGSLKFEHLTSLKTTAEGLEWFPGGSNKGFSFIGFALLYPLWHKYHDHVAQILTPLSTLLGSLIRTQKCITFYCIWHHVAPRIAYTPLLSDLDLALAWYQYILVSTDYCLAMESMQSCMVTSGNNK